MIQRVALYFVFPMMLIAFFLAIIGVQQIEFGETYYQFFGNVTSRFNNWKLTIPDIPKIPSVDYTQGDRDTGFLKAIANILNFFVVVINALISILNIFVSIINIAIQLVQFILTFVYSVKDFIDGFRSQAAFAFV